MVLRRVTVVQSRYRSLQLGLLTIYLLFLYTKSDREDPSPQQLRTLSRLIRQELT